MSHHRKINAYSPDERKRILDSLVALVCSEYNQDPDTIKRNGRQKKEVSQVRQIIMYLAHVEWSLTMQQIADYFGMDRTNLRHACAKIEDMRDLPEFDTKMDELAFASGIEGLSDAKLQVPEVTIVKDGKWHRMSQKTREAIVEIADVAAKHLSAAG